MVIKFLLIDDLKEAIRNLPNLPIYVRDSDGKLVPAKDVEYNNDEEGIIIK